MRMAPEAILLKRVSFRSLALTGFVIVYILLSIGVFAFWVNPTLTGTSDQHIAADSTTYIYFADTIRQGRPDPFVYAALTTFPNNLWVPVLLALVLNSTVATVVVNYAFFFISIFLFRKTYSFSMGIFLILLFVNPTTMISLISVNKEIVDVLAVAAFLYARRRHSRGMLFLALVVALANRFELCALMLVFLLAASKFNPLRQRRVVTLWVLVFLLGLALPLLGSHSLEVRFEEASSGGVVKWLDSLEIHYLFFLAVIPKIAETYFGELINVSAWEKYSLSDLANSYILLFNNLATAVVFIVVAAKRLFTTRYDTVYFAAMGSVFMAASLVIQPRYFYFAYVVLCLQAARPQRQWSEPDLVTQPRLAEVSIE